MIRRRAVGPEIERRDDAALGIRCPVQEVERSDRRVTAGSRSEIRLAPTADRTRRRPTGQEINGMPHGASSLGQGRGREPVHDGEVGACRGDHGEHARPADGVPALHSGVPSHYAADTGQVEFINHGTGLDTHPQIIAPIAPKR
jgi:hypothetical protein